MDSPPFSLSPSSLTSSILPHPPPWVQFPGIATLQLGIEYLKVKWWLLTPHQFVKSWLQTTVVTIVNQHFHLLHPAWHFMTPLFYISWFIFLLSGVASEVGIWKSLEWMMKLGSSWKRWCQPSFVLVLLARWASLVLSQYQHKNKYSFQLFIHFPENYLRDSWSIIRCLILKWNGFVM